MIDLYRPTMRHPASSHDSARAAPTTRGGARLSGRGMSQGADKLDGTGIRACA